MRLRCECVSWIGSKRTVDLSVTQIFRTSAGVTSRRNDPRVHATRPGRMLKKEAPISIRDIFVKVGRLALMHDAACIQMGINRAAIKVRIR
jgi:hypothetical protein